MNYNINSEKTTNNNNHRYELKKSVVFTKNHLPHVYTLVIIIICLIFVCVILKDNFLLCMFCGCLMSNILLHASNTYKTYIIHNCIFNKTIYLWHRENGITTTIKNCNKQLNFLSYLTYSIHQRMLYLNRLIYEDI